MRRRRPSRLCAALPWALGLALGLGLRPGVAAAQPEMTRALSRTAFEEGMRLYKAGNYPAACAKLEESLQLDAQMGTRFWLADCYEHAGRPATAWSHFLAVAAEAKAAGNATREATARARADALAPTLPRLVVIVSDAVRATPGLTVQRDETVLGPILWGTPIPVDPGDHKLRASAPGKEPWDTTVNVGASGGRVEVPPLREQVVRSPVEPVQAPGPILPATPVLETVVPPKSGTWRRPFLITTGVIGGDLVVVGGIFGILAFPTWHSALALCPSRTGCSAAALSEQTKASTFATVADVGLAVGGAALATTLVVWLTTPRSPALPVHVAPTVGGFVVGGSLP